MDNQASKNESGINQLNHVMNNNHEDDSESGNLKINHQDHNDVKSAKMKSLKNNDLFNQPVNNVKKNIPNNLVLDKDVDLEDFSSPDSDDLFGRNSVNITNKSISNVNNTVNRTKTINNNVSNAQSIRDASGNKRNGDNNLNISSELVILNTNGNGENTPQKVPVGSNDTVDKANSIPNKDISDMAKVKVINIMSDKDNHSNNIPDEFSNTPGRNSPHKSENSNQLPANNLSDMVERVNSLNSKMSPGVVFHTPHTTPLKLKLNSLPVQSHPLDERALNGEDGCRNEPLDFPDSPVLSKCIDEICLKRYKRSPNSLSEWGDKDSPKKSEMKSDGKDLVRELAESKKDLVKDPEKTLTTDSGNCKELKATELNSLKTPSSSLESVSLAKSPEFTNNVSAEAYLKKYDDIHAQVRAYLNKTQESANKTQDTAVGNPSGSAFNKSDLDELNERSRRFLNPHGTHSGDLAASNKTTYVSDEEDLSQYDTIVSHDCHGVKLIKNQRKNDRPSSLDTSLPGQSKKKLLPADLFSGNLLDDDVNSLSDEDLDDLLSPGDDDVENSILEQLNISDDDIPELSAQEEREESRRWKIAMVNGVEKRIDMKVIEPYKRVLSHGGYLSEDCHNAIIVFSACFLPHHSRADYHYVMDNLFFYVLHTLDQLITEDYVLVYLHGATSRHNMPTFSWLKRCYQMIDRKLKKNLKQLYLVHATFWLKTIVVMSKPFISSKFSKKVQFIMSLNELQEKLPIEEASIPDKVRQYDKIKLSMSQSH